PVLLDMHIIVPGVYDAEHKALLVFDTSSLKEANPEDYELVASDNINGPDEGQSSGSGGQGNGGTGGSGGQGDGDGIPPSNTNGDDDDDKNKHEETTKPAQAFIVDYTIKEADKDSESVADNFFTAKPAILH